MRFTCPKCGKKYASADEPAPGRVYSLTCRCGTKITVKGPEPQAPGAPGLTSAPSAARGFDPFPSERRRTAGGAPVSSVDTGSLPTSRPGEPTPSSSWSSGSQTQRVPLREATPAPFPPPVVARPPPAAPARSAPVAPSAAPSPAASLDPFAAYAAPAAAPPAPRPAAPLDPFADMPDLQAEARGEARPLTSVPDINGPLPEPPAASPSFDPFAAQQGLLLDEGEARAIAGRAPVLEPRVEPGAPEDAESSVTFSDQIPVPSARRARALVPRVASRGRGRLVLALGALAVVGAGAAAAWFFLGRTRPSTPAQAVARPPPPDAAAPLGSPPLPAPVPPVVAAPAPAPQPPAPPPAEPRPEPRREAPRKAEPRRAQRQVAAAPDPAPRREPDRAEPPAKADEPAKKPEEPPKKAAPDKSAPDLVARKQDAGPGAAPPGGAVRGELSSAEVGASIKASAKAFDGCVAEAARNEPALQVVGRRVGLYITVNPSGTVTGPRLDDAEVDDSVLGACLKATARKMVFPAFQGEAFQVRIPMVLGGGR